MRPKKLRAIRLERKSRKKSIEKGKNIEKVVLQLQEIILSFLLEKNKETLVKLLALAIIKKAITQGIILNLSQKTSCNLGNLHIGDYQFGS